MYLCHLCTFRLRGNIMKVEHSTNVSVNPVAYVEKVVRHVGKQEDPTKTLLGRVLMYKFGGDMLRFRKDMAQAVQRDRSCHHCPTCKELDKQIIDWAKNSAVPIWPSPFGEVSHYFPTTFLQLNILYTVPWVLATENFSRNFPSLSPRGCQASTVSRVGCVQCRNWNQFVKRFHHVRADKAVPSPYANAFGFAPAFA